MKINGQMVKVKQPYLDIGLDELAGKVEARLPKFLQRAGKSADADTIYIPSDGNGNEAGVMNIESVDWWDMVKYDKIDANQALSTFNNDSNLQHENTAALGGSFIVLSFVLLFCLFLSTECARIQCIGNIAFQLFFWYLQEKRTSSMPLLVSWHSV